MSKADAKPADIAHAHAVVWIDHLTASQLHVEASDHPTDREIIVLGRRRFGLD